MKTILAELNKVINSLEEKGYIKEASQLNDVFLRYAQDDVSSEKFTNVNSYRALGPKMRAAIVEIQNNLKIPADAMFGPSTAYAIVKALDGIAPEKTLDKAYVQRAREYAKSLPAGFVTKLKAYVGRKNEIRNLINMPNIRKTEIEPSDLKMELIENLGGYRG